MEGQRPAYSPSDSDGRRSAWDGGRNPCICRGYSDRGCSSLQRPSISIVQVAGPQIGLTGAVEVVDVAYGVIVVVSGPSPLTPSPPLGVSRFCRPTATACSIRIGDDRLAA